jgi:hypothetical protein
MKVSSWYEFMRSFSFKWVMQPRSVEESVIIDNIARLFKFHALPEVQQSGWSKYLVFPAEFDITYFNRNQENPFLPRISTCICKSVNLTYGSGEPFISHKGGAPTMVTLELQFDELEIMTKERVKDGY